MVVNDHEHPEYITFRELNDYVTREVVEMHTIRIQSLKEFSDSISRMETFLKEQTDRNAADIKEHEEWHQQQLETIIRQQPLNSRGRWALGTQIAAMLIAFLALIVSILVVIIHS